MISKKKWILMAMMVMSLGAASCSLAAEPVTTNNPYGLVYANAITTNEKGKVNIHPVTYYLDGRTIAANVYTPKNYNPAKSYAAVVVAHPNGGVKEQVAGLYAQRLAEAGYITMAADASFQGASSGEPRHQDIPYFRTEDIHGMMDYISQYPGVEKNRIGAQPLDVRRNIHD